MASRWFFNLVGSDRSVSAHFKLYSFIQSFVHSVICSLSHSFICIIAAVSKFLAVSPMRRFLDLLLLFFLKGSHCISGYSSCHPDHRCVLRFTSVMVGLLTSVFLEFSNISVIFHSVRILKGINY